MHNPNPKEATVVITYSESDKELIEKKIDEAEFEAIKTAEDGLLRVLRLEEKYNFVIDNYVEFEQELHFLALKSIVHSTGWTDISNIQLFNMRLVNLLSTCRLYTDYLIEHAFSITDKIQKIQSERDRVRASNYTYRLMHALRNYSQHRGLLINNMTITAKRVRADKFRHIVTPQLSVSQLGLDPKMDTELIAELKAQGDLIDIKPYIRGYIQTIFELHRYARKLFYSDYSQWNQLLNTTISTHLDATKGKLQCFISANGRKINVNPIIDCIKRCEWLISKNNIINYLPDQYISSETNSDN